MKVQSPPTQMLPKPLNKASSEPEQPPAGGSRDPYADYNEVDADKHRPSYEAAYNLSRGLAFGVEGGARIGQTMHLGSSLLGLNAGPLAGSVGLVGGTIDVARGASRAQQSAINRNPNGALAGGLQIAQGLATWASVGATVAGAPPIVAQVAAGAALGALAGRMGVDAYASRAASRPKETKGDRVRPQVSVEADTKAKPKERADMMVRSFALAQAVNGAASQFGGMAAGWNNLQGVWKGSAPEGIWQGLGIVGSTYSVLQGASQVARAASNQHLDDTLAGTLGIVQGAASMAVSMGVGGRLLPGIAVATWVAKQAIPLLQLKKRISSEEESENDSMMNRLKENVKLAFSGAPEESREVRKAEKVAESQEAQEEQKDEKAA